VSTAGRDHSGQDLATLRREYLEFLDVQYQAYIDLRDSVDAAADVFRVLRAQVEQEANIRDLGAFIDPKPLRAALIAGFEEFERTRRTGQRMLFRLLLAEGATVDDISRAWNLPRDVVQRVVDDRGDDVTDDREV
jgi:hypothetical protein